MRQIRSPDVIVQGFSSDGRDSPRIAQILVQGSEGWEQRDIDLDAISRALSGAHQVERKQSLSAIIRTQVQTIAAARKRGASWITICDAFVAQGIPVDPDALRKLYWRIATEKTNGKRRPRTLSRVATTTHQST